MNRTMRHLVLGVSTGVTVFTIVVPLIHLLAELAKFVGLQLRTWDNPVEVFVFVVTAVMVGVFPWGLWILLTDARKANLFNEGREVAGYLLAALIVFLALTLLVCTRVQHIYAQYRWFLSPALLVCAVALIRWRWRKVWRLPTGMGLAGTLGHALAL